jgi:hypothetical protein
MSAQQPASFIPASFINDGERLNEAPLMKARL